MFDIEINDAANDVLTDQSGRQYIDLFSGFGACWLGHGNNEVTNAVRSQLGRVWMTGAIANETRSAAIQILHDFFGESWSVPQLFSTGMEASEFAMRHARVTTGRNRFVGFDRSMHGKSMATAFLGWDNGDNIQLPDLERLPFVNTESEETILRCLEQSLADHSVAAVFIEPMQGSGGGHRANDDFYIELQRMCRNTGTLMIFDEILTGFYRTGPRFFFEGLELQPDVVLIGKALGNGFPVSGVVSRREFPVTSAMMPSSTFSANPLASAAVLATIQELQRYPVSSAVQGIEEQLSKIIPDLTSAGFVVRGRGAFWILEIPAHVNGRDFVTELYQHGVAVGFGGGFIRLMPPATIELSNLRHACEVISKATKVLEVGV